eukprot:TRINITY_DN5352_c0_g1::TRINITY_DN5352_c0_g1_i1::g.24151::m.24151 TRINITY_DN5352_c0_g1::TRINITY_DN5352_c0_g1_i1::g.24151  ORF type:complete len:122 (-),score=6.42 TRINITY_DN5352_c0_g1_i1:204-569(-)
MFQGTTGLLNIENLRQEDKIFIFIASLQFYLLYTFSVYFITQISTAIFFLLKSVDTLLRVFWKFMLVASIALVASDVIRGALTRENTHEVFTAALTMYFAVLDSVQEFLLNFWSRLVTSVQ